MDNYMELIVPSLSKNEAFARNAVAAFCVELNPTVDEIDDVKTAVSEAVTNCIVHAYGDQNGKIIIRAALKDNALMLEITDRGKGIDDIARARKAFFTTRPDDERSGLGFTIMENLMSDVEVVKNEEGGTTVKMCKNFERGN